VSDNRKPYLGPRGTHTGRVPYLGDTKTNTKRVPYLGGSSTQAAPKEHKHHGFLSTLKHVVTQTPTVETVKHPLRHPGDTLLLALPAVGRAAKLGEAAALAKAGGSAGDVVKAATVGVKPGPRVLHVGDMEVRGHYSRAAGSRVAQKLTDRALEKGAQRPGKVGVKVENQLHRRAAKWESRNQRTADAVARAPGTAVAALGKKLKPSRAPRAPPRRRRSPGRAQARGAGDAEGPRHQRERAGAPPGPD
jgi:hypothetical protein